MKIVIVIIMAALVQVSAATRAQQITLNANKASLKSVFNQIRKQTGYTVLCQSEQLNHARPVTVKLHNAPLSEALNSILTDQDLTYTIEDKAIVINEKNQALADSKPIAPADSVVYKGRVLDEKGQPLIGATIRLKGGTKVSISVPGGYFERYGTPKNTLVVSYIGYQTAEISLSGRSPNDLILVNMVPSLSQLTEVGVVSTGYQDIPKERATGSFELVTAKDLAHSTDPSLLNRLQGITTSLDFRNDTRAINSGTATKPLPAISTLTIRGRNTLNTAITSSASINKNPSGTPLVVVDGIAGAYDIESIDPNDVESISILKDAAAASIWGSRAANGVIVIKTKRGGFNRPTRVSFNANYNVTEKIDLFYKKLMSTSDFIDAQVYANQFDYPNPVPDPTDYHQPQPFMSPVAEILNQQKLGVISAGEANKQLDALRGNDIRRDYNKYILRNAQTQSYSLAIDGGTKAIASRLSGNFSNTLNNTIGSSSDRFTLSYNASAQPLKNLSVNANINLTRQDSRSQASSSLIDPSNYTAPFYPYTRLADDQGNALTVSRDYRPAYLNLLTNVYGSKLLNMSYTPLNDMKEGYLKNTNYGINLNTTIGYQINPVFSVNVTYSYNKAISSAKELRTQQSYYMRNLINQFTDSTTFSRAVPLGGYYAPNNTQSDTHTLRGLLNVNKTWNDKHNLTGIIGVDVSQTYSTYNQNQYYGYDPNTLKVNNALNFSTALTTFFSNPIDGSTTALIPSSAAFLDYWNRQYSLFANGAYTYNNRYILSGSVRKDASSAFGPATNKSGSPYYSFGSAWLINNEDFYKLSWLPSLKLRVTYGYNGNVNTRVTANPLITYSTTPGSNGLFYATTAAAVATNSKLRPERSGILNIGLDFGLKNDWLSGSIEYYDRKTFDLLTPNNVDPTIGYNQLTFNTGNLRSQGVDLTLNSVNLQTGAFNWTSNLLFSYNRVKVTRLFIPGANTAGYIVGNQYTEGYDLNRLFAWKWAGLDPQTGNPRVFLNGQPVTVDGTDFTVIDKLNNAPITELKYFGSAVPVYFGSFRNTFTYGAFSISANLLYKLGYFARRSAQSVVQYSNLYGEFGVNIPQSADYAQRWQKPGDEKTTNVPSPVYSPGATARDSYYYYADVNVYKADHIRLQEINLSYVFPKRNWFIKNPRIYANVSNLGIIWRANKLGLDPDVFDYPVPRQYSLGFSANF
ncbi:SusC/RagA family TonB-linked outer membrane protein [Mucilaginibacter sp. UR6-11]|uniref:SusC/RagA family TonB-linked outer membrane protein n=1 Tax=Mucilaginibacter sp. UR6-11 TaxID=1435644 RepID=UPI001E4F4DDC|nr:SusC/RagA family TonB-linked outer membrane protein [Mucilaginibacter sp. UR6-11]MCC8425950.1 SusC/RagA family TonB-linked outer membrane protein [Mucilaginibacter sp. UR6-11]